MMAVPCWARTGAVAETVLIVCGDSMCVPSIARGGGGQSTHTKKARSAPEWCGESSRFHARSVPLPPGVPPADLVAATPAPLGIPGTVGGAAYATCPHAW